VAVGDTLTYRIGVTNAGPLEASATVTDLLPDGFSFVSATPSQGGPCTRDAQTLTCPLGPLAVNASATIDLVGTATDAGTQKNTAIVSTVEPKRIDPDLTNNVASVLTNVVGVADLAVTKTQSAPTLQIGQTLTYTLRVTNNGPSVATNVELTDVLPSAHATFESASPGQGSCTGTTRLTCSLGTLNVGASATVTVVVRATSAGVLPNAADVTGTEPDPNLANNSATTGAIVLPPIPPSTPNADVSVTKTAVSSSATVGQPFTYRLVVRNDGPGTATGVVVIESIPGGASRNSVTPSQGTCGTPQQFTCELGTLSAGAQATITVVATPLRAGTFTNLVTVTANEPDPNPDNNVDTESATATGNADLAIIKQATPNPVGLGEILQYRMSVRNNGPAEATNVVVQDLLPAGVTLIDVRSSQGSCTGTTLLTCNLGRLASGGSARIGIRVRVKSEGDLLNVARVTADQPDPNPANNIDSVETKVSTVEPEAVADLGVTKTASASTVFVDDTVTYTIVATNHSPDPATGVIVTDTLPQGATLVSIAPSQGTCNGAGIIECEIGTLAGGASATVTLVVRATIEGPFDNFVQVVGNEVDQVPGNDEATVPGTVLPTTSPNPPIPPNPPSGPALDVTKTASTLRPALDDAVTFTITVTNKTSSALNNVVVTDPLPAGLSLISVTVSEGSCTGTTTVRCDFGTLDAGKTATITVVARATAEGSLTNTVTVSTPNAPDGSASVTIVVERPVRQPENDDKDAERREERRNEEERQRHQQEEEETQGTVVAVMCAATAPRPSEPVAEDDGADPPYIVIVTLDGHQKLRLRRDARKACPFIQINDYVEAVGEKQHEYLFDADDVKVRGARR
jgi:uncharacterized repeat protein (TIGR01451 family)